MSQFNDKDNEMLQYKVYNTSINPESNENIEDINLFRLFKTQLMDLEEEKPKSPIRQNENVDISFHKSPDIKILDQNNIINKSNSYLYKNQRSSIKELPINIFDKDFNLSPIRTFSKKESNECEIPILTPSLFCSSFNESDMKNNDSLTPTIVFNEASKLEDSIKESQINKSHQEESLCDTKIIEESEVEYEEEEKDQFITLSDQNQIPTQELLKNISFESLNEKKIVSPLKSPIIHSLALSNRSVNLLFKKNILFSTLLETNTELKQNEKNFFGEGTSKTSGNEYINKIELIKKTKRKEFQYYPNTTTSIKREQSVSAHDLLKKTQLLETLLLNEKKATKKPKPPDSNKSELISFKQYLQKDIIKEDLTSKISSLKRSSNSPFNEKLKQIKLDDCFMDADISDTQMCNLFNDVETNLEKIEKESHLNKPIRRKLQFNENLHSLNENEKFPENNHFYQTIQKLDFDIESIQKKTLGQKEKKGKEEELKTKYEIISENLNIDFIAIETIQEDKNQNNIKKRDDIEYDIVRKINLLESNKMETPKTTACQGFSTASGKKLKISENSLKKAKQIFDQIESSDIPNESHLNKKKELENKMLRCKNESSNKSPEFLTSTPKFDKFPCFSIASGKKLNFSENNLIRAKKIFEEFNLENESGFDKKIENKGTPQSYNFCGFSTASGKKVKISESNLVKAKKLFQETEAEEEKMVPFDTPKSSHFLGFSTASGKKVNISENSLKRSKELFSHIDNQTPLMTDISKINKDNIKKRKLISESETPKSFSIAYEKQLNMSASNLIKEKELFEKINTDENIDTPKSCKTLDKINKMQIFSETPKSSGFSTASGKRVDISINSLRKAQKLFDETLNETPKNTHNILLTKSETPKTNLICGFSTASGKRVNILENNLKKAKELFLGTSQEQDASHLINSEHMLKKKNLNSIFLEEINSKQSFSKMTNSEKSLLPSTPHQTDLTESFENEVSEMTAALFEDEINETMSKMPIPLVSDPEITLDRHSGVGPPMIAKPALPTSPVLNSFDRAIKNKERIAKIKASLLNQAANAQIKLEKQIVNKSSSTFKVPYKTNESGEILPPTSQNEIKRTLEFGSIFNKDYSSEKQENKTKTLPSLEEVNSGREQARKLQCRQISLSRRNGSNIKPLPGSWYLRKQDSIEEHLSWKQAVSGNRPGRYTFKQLLEFGLKENVINVTSQNAENCRFLMHDYYSKSYCMYNIDGIEMGDGAKLILASDGTAGLEEISLAFLSSPGISPSLIPCDWIKNHYRWIVWKLAATECSFPQYFGTRALTPNHVLLQLKYRYDRELDKAERPALRRILERDDSSCKRMILCVASIFSMDKPPANTFKFANESSLYELELTDGWYSVRACIDPAMSQLISSGRVVVGTKLVVQGAELIGVEQGCSPLEPGALEARLRLVTNSTRRARWDARLGFCSCPGPLFVPLSTIVLHGGIIGAVRVLILRIYPLLFVEKFPDGKSVVRSERSEKQEAANFERRRITKLEEAFSKAQAELEQVENQPAKKTPKLDTRNVSKLSTGEDLCQAIELATDPDSIQNLLNSQQMQALEHYRQEKQERLYQDLQSKVKEHLEKYKYHTKREITTLLKVRIMDILNKDTSPRIMVLSIWRPSNETISFFKESLSLNIFNLTCSKNRDNEMQLSTTRSTRYEPLRISYHNLIEPRQAQNFKHLYVSDFKPSYGELDIVGLVVHIEDGPGSFQTVYLSDAQKVIFGICFWGGLKAFTCEQLIEQKKLITASNLQWRSGASVKWIPCGYATELSSFSLNPRANHMIKALNELREALPKNLHEFTDECQNQVISLLKEKMRPKLPSQSPISKQDLNKSSERIARLSFYGEAPKLPPLNTSKKKNYCGLARRSDFKPPKRKLTPPPPESPPESPPLEDSP